MTKEEAIKWLEEIIQDTDTYWGSCSKALQKELDEQKQVFLLALSALRPITREQVEKVWRGEWQYYPEDYDELTWTCSRCGEPWNLIDGTPDDNNMDFCPACGAPMTDKAVQMVMERLEGMKDEAD